MSKSMTKFMTRDAANTGVRVPLLDGSGKDTGEFMTVRGMDSDAFRMAQNLSRRKYMELKTKCEAEGYTPTREESVKHLERERLELLVPLVADWSLEEECTPDNVRTLLTEAPSLSDLVDRVSSERHRFFNSGLDSSVPVSDPKQS